MVDSRHRQQARDESAMVRLFCNGIHSVRHHKSRVGGDLSLRSIAGTEIAAFVLDGNAPASGSRSRNS